MAKFIVETINPEDVGSYIVESKGGVKNYYIV